ncbi:hypothetical protein JL722_14933 [Aureococcus anophagefferens]|nr:hypothetical protein JL722_14933 [Aureococcus anophagefferens]
MDNLSAHFGADIDDYFDPTGTTSAAPSGVMVRIIDGAMFFSTSTTLIHFSEFAMVCCRQTRAKRIAAQTQQRATRSSCAGSARPMYYPKTVPQGLVWLLLGLCGGGTWPALRQAIKSVDFEVFNLGFIVSMSGTGIALLSLLSLPPTRDPPPPPFGPGDWDGLWEALAWEAADSGASLWLATCAGACVSTSNVLLVAAMPLAGLTRASRLQRSRHDAARMPAKTARGLLSASNLQDLVHSKAPSRDSLDSLLELAVKRGEAREDEPILLVDEPPPAETVARGLALCAAAGAIDGCWSSLTCAAKLRGIDNYVTATFFCVGLLVPLLLVEAGILLRDARGHARKLRRLTPNQLLVSLACTLNIWGIVTYFMATVQLSAAVAFAIFLSTPLVSISIGCRLRSESGCSGSRRYFDPTASAVTFWPAAWTGGASDAPNAAITAGDLVGGDGLADILVGGYDGGVVLFVNAGSGDAPVFVETPWDYGAVNASSSASPWLADIFDDDGLLDLVVGERLSGTVRLYRNGGTASRPDFSGGPTLTVEASKSCCYLQPTTGDLDHDGDLDLLVGTSGGAGPRLVDLDGDATLDLVGQASSSDNVPSVYTNVGSVYAARFALDDALLGGFDGSGFGALQALFVDVFADDGFDDLIVFDTDLREFVALESLPTGGDPAYAYRSGAASVLAAYETSRTAAAAAVDVDGDGDADLVVASPSAAAASTTPRAPASSKRRRRSGRRSKSWTRRSRPSRAPRATSPSSPSRRTSSTASTALAYCDGWHWFSRASGAEPRGVYTADDEVDASWAAALDAAGHGPVYGVSFGDVDGDGDDDVVFGDWYSQALFRVANTEASFAVDTDLVLDTGGSPCATYACSPQLGDVDGDGDLDLVVGCNSVLYHYENVGDATTMSLAAATSGALDLVSVSTASRPRPLLADLDGDADLDLLLATTDGSVAYYEAGYCVPSGPCGSQGLCDEDAPSPQCDCLIGFAGPQCFECQEGYFSTTCELCPEGGDEDRSKPRITDTCGVKNSGRSRGSCDDGVEGTGACACFESFSGESCAEGTCPDGSVEVGVVAGSFNNALCQAAPRAGRGRGRRRGGAAACAPCAAGRVSAAAAESCDACPAGSFAGAAGAAACAACGAGTYASEASAACDACPAGFVSGPAAAACAQCPAGRATTNGTVCEACAAGTFSPSGATRCLACDGGKYAGRGAEFCSDCAAGTRSNASAAAATARGTYSPASSSFCVACPENSASAPGSATCASCDVGEVPTAGNGTCVACPPAPTPSSARGLRALRAGRFGASPGLGACSFCAAGSYAAAGATACGTCDAGSASGPNAERCEPAAPARSASSTCDQCAAGRAAAAGSAACDLCPAGAFSTAGAGACMPCEADTFASSNGSGWCAACDPNDHATSRSGAALCDVCHAGYAFDGARCVACPNGAQCDGFGVELATATLPLHRGRWRTSRRSTVVERCPLRGACRPPEDPNATTSGDDLCDPTTEGPLCAICRAGYYESGARACERCGGGEIVLYVLPTICVLFFIAIVFSLKAAKVDTRAPRPDEFRGTSSRAVSADNVGKAIEGVRDKRAPKPAAAAQSRRSKRRLSATNKDKVDDAKARDRYWRARLTTTLKQLSTLFAVLTALPWTLELDFPASFNALLDATDWANLDLVRLVPLACVADALPLEKRLRIRALVTQIALVGSYLVYPAVSSKVFRALRPCLELDEKYGGSRTWFRDDFSLPCDSSRYEFMRAFAVLMVFVWPFRVPAVYFSVLYRHRARSIRRAGDGLPVRRRLGHRDAVDQDHRDDAPFVDDADDALTEAAMWSIMLVFFGALLIRVDVEGDSDAMRDAMGATLVVVTVLPVVIGLVTVLYSARLAHVAEPEDQPSDGHTITDNPMLSQQARASFFEREGGVELKRAAV